MSISQPDIPPKPSRLHGAGLRLRAVVLVAGLAVVLVSSAIGVRLYGHGQSTVTCTTIGCTALVFLGFWGELVAFVGGLTLAWGMYNRVIQNRKKKKESG